MWIKKFLQKKRQHSEEMYWRWVYGLMGLSSYQPDIINYETKEIM